MTLLRHSAAALAAAVAAPVAASALLLRPAWRRGLGERLGRVEPVAPGGVWVHAASVGEGLAASRLIAALQERNVRVYASTTTVGGRDVLREHLAGGRCDLVPADHRWCVDAAMRRVRPAALVLIETEIWPALLAGAERAAATPLLVSGRISDRSFRRKHAMRALLGPALRRLHRVGAQSPLDAERFVALGVPEDRVEVTGNLKVDAPVRVEPLAPELAALLSAAGVRCLVAGSTHPGEEIAALQALATCEAAGHAVSLVIAPRHVERADALWRWLSGTDRSVRRRSALDCTSPLASGEVLLLDSLGELPAVYARAAASFVGGSLLPVGGHNLLEPVEAGSPVCFGPHVSSAAGLDALLEECGAGVRVTDADALGAAFVALLSRGDAAGRAAAARARLAPHRGSVGRSLALVMDALEGCGR